MYVCVRVCMYVDTRVYTQLPRADALEDISVLMCVSTLEIFLLNGRRMLDMYADKQRQEYSRHSDVNTDI